MVNLTVRNIPETVLKHIRFYAIGSRRSVNSELLIVLEEGLASRTRDAVTDRSAEFSAGSRDRLWKELRGSWEDSEDMTLRIESAYRLRNGTSRGDENDSV